MSMNNATTVSFFFSVQLNRRKPSIRFRTVLISMVPLFLLFGLTLFVSIIVGVGAPKTSNNKYMTFFTPEYSRRYIYLEDKFSYSVQLILHTGSSFPNLYSSHSIIPPNINNNNTSTTIRGDVEFIIKAPDYSYYGVVAIIQNLNLRLKHKFENSSSKCRDYIQFSTENESYSSPNQNQVICGKLPRGSDTESTQPPGLVGGGRTFFNPNGGVRLKVHVDHQNFQDIMELSTIGAEVVFTAYTECPSPPSNSMKTLRPCSSSTSLSCIYSELFCDSKVDCGFEGEEFGLDENGSECWMPYVYLGVGLSFVLLVIIVIYGFIHWIKAKVKKGVQSGRRSQYLEDHGGDATMCADVGMDMDASMAAF